jgi:predicted ribosome quality control (RQC) complex YloA/Tae2 family protein
MALWSIVRAMDAILLLAALSEIERTLVGGLVREVVAADPHGLWIDLATSRGPDALLISADTALPRIVRGGTRPPKTRPLPALAGVARRILPGARLAAVVHEGLDRLVRLDFEPALGSRVEDAAGAGGQIILELFGNQPNLILADAGESILEAARHTSTPDGRQRVPGAIYAPPPVSDRPDPRLLGSPDAIGRVLEPLLADGLSPARALRTGLMGIGDLWAREIAARAADASAPAIARSLMDVLHRIEAGPCDPRLLLDESGHPQAVSPLPLAHLPEARQQPVASLAEAVERVAAHLNARREFEAGQAALRQLVHRLEARLRSRRIKLTEEAAEFAQADVTQRMAEILVANQHAVVRGATEAVLPDYVVGPDAVIRIPLDPTLGPGANADRLFQAARRARRGTMRVASRLAETDRDLARLTSLLPRVLSAGRPEELDAARQELERMPHLLGPRDRAALPPPRGEAARSGMPAAAKKPAPVRRAATGRKSEGPEPRRFVSSEGLPILIGRDNEGNDHLTLHLARSEDLWLHAEGFPGSHVVIRMQDRTGGVPRQTLVEAAKLAAYYSQARSHGKVSVSYTLKKYVRKPRKSPPGLVTVTHEKSIVVKPDKELVGRLSVSKLEEE